MSSEKVHHSSFDRTIHGAAYALLSIIAMAHPWEVYQRIPLIGFTLMKVAGALLIPLALIAWWRSGHPKLRTGAAAPILAFATCCLLSLVFSVDPETTATHIISYTAYLPFFFALVIFIDSPDRAKSLMNIYVASAVVVAVIACLCAIGQLWPIRWDAPSWATQRLIHEYRAGLPMRMTATAGDFNLAALEALIALAFILFGSSAQKTILMRILRWSCVALLSASIAIAMSRSGLLIAALLILASFIRGKRGLAVATSVATIGSIAAVFIFLWVDIPFIDTMRDRLLGGVARDDGSIRGRMAVYNIAVGLIPQYIITGCGLGAIDTAMALTPQKDDVVMTLHSTTLKILIETGLAGFLSFMWLCIAAIRCTLQTGSPTVSRPIVAAFAAALLMLSVQPFPLLSLYPFIFALAFGARGSSKEPQFNPTPPVIPISASCAFAAIVAINIAAYQQTAQRYEAYTDAIEIGADAMNHAAFSESISQFDSAITLAQQIPDTIAYRTEAERILQTDSLYRDMGVPATNPAPLTVAHFLRGRTKLALGDWDSAHADLENAINLDGQFTVAHYPLAEAAWRDGRFRDALSLYETSPVPVPITGEPSLQDAAALRRGGNWQEAVAMYEALSALPNPNAEIWFNLGIAAELNNNSQRAKQMYTQALDTDPNHEGAAARLATFE